MSPGGAAAGGLALRTIESRGSQVLRLRGRIDVSSTNELSGALGRAGELGRELIVDLTAAELVDSAALGTLLLAQKQARRRGGDLVLAGAGPGIRLVLEQTGLDRTFRLLESVHGR
jgi:anti-anti-sigma factor